MKKIFVLAFAALSFVSCNKGSDASSYKQGYVDTAKLIENSDEAKAIEEKYKNKSEEIGKELRAEIEAFEREAKNFQANAQVKGMQWAQTEGQRLGQKEQELQIKQQSALQTLQQESGKDMQDLVAKMKEQISEYGKQNGYDFVLGTGDASTVLFAKSEYDLTEIVTKLINDKYKGPKAETKSDSTAVN
ncbi:OmpH family outer membrane protein [Flavobacterium agricola]|uniref:OmpH family outer membrane protein n=1 Tax=Flavobacterium agricola TaxID=2870839 RepID=A0ABY6LZX0_9FLAO|nr:OmpH family outer membrane protein [Flavobacterium agricola]UYW01020.1 OmpH family outer membrane protein [Flavobacterium agricola]